MSDINGSIENMIIDSSSGNVICKKHMTREMRETLLNIEFSRLALSQGDWNDLEFLIEVPFKSLLIKTECVIDLFPLKWGWVIYLSFNEKILAHQFGWGFSRIKRWSCLT